MSKILFTNRKKNIARKIRELWFALQIERLYSKKEILTFYFNQIYYGHGCYGVKAAARFFFKKNLKDINLAEAALLAGIPKSTTYYSPLRYTKNAMKRHKLVLNSMAANNFISPSTANNAWRAFWVNFNSQLRNRHQTITDLDNDKAPYFREYIRSRLEKMLGKKELYRGGMVIHTSLNLDHQLRAQSYLWEALEKIDKISSKTIEKNTKFIELNVLGQLRLLSTIFNIKGMNINQGQFKKKLRTEIVDKYMNQLSLLGFLNNQPSYFELFKNLEEIKAELNYKKVEGALVSIDPTTGYITAMVGGTGFNYFNQINRVFYAKRQIGSLMKPFVYAAAIDTQKVTASTIVDDSPAGFGSKGQNLYIPQNYSGSYRGPVLVRTALIKSINVPTIKVLSRTGLPVVRNYAASVFRSFSEKEQGEKFPRDLTMGLGSGVFSPFDVATAYSVLANEGREVIPISIRYITDRDGTLITNIERSLRKRPRQLLDPATTYIISKIQNGVFQPGGTAFRSDLLENYSLRNASSGKTGTTSSWKDAWFAGFNKYLATVIWIGYDNNKSLGKEMSGGRLAAPIWILYNRDIMKNAKKISLVKPNNVVTRRVCFESGLLQSHSCTKVYNENYIKGTQPSEFCSLHIKEYKEEEEFVRAYSSEEHRARSQKFLDFIHKK